MFSYSEVVKTVYFDPLYIQTSREAHYFAFKAEVLLTSEKQYGIQLYEQHFYEIQPSFSKESASEQLWTESTMPIEVESILEATPERALEVLIERLKAVLPSAFKENDL